MNNSDLVHYRIDAEKTSTIEELRQKVEFAYLSIKYGLNKWYYEEVANIYLYEISYRQSCSTANRYYQKIYINGYYV